MSFVTIVNRAEPTDIPVRRVAWFRIIFIKAFGQAALLGWNLLCYRRMIKAYGLLVKDESGKILLF